LLCPDWILKSLYNTIKSISQINPRIGEPSFAKASEWQARRSSAKNGKLMYYCYIPLSPKSHIFYFGSTKDLKKRFGLHNAGGVNSTKSHLPWELVWYSAFQTGKEAVDFEQYLKTGSGKAFAYKRFVAEALKKDFSNGRISSLKLSAAKAKE